MAKNYVPISYKKRKCQIPGYKNWYKPLAGNIMLK